MKRYSPISEHLCAHLGRTAVVCGGGPSLPAHLEQAPRDALYIAANGHLLKLRSADYIVCVDPLEKQLRPLGVPLVSPRIWADIRVFAEPVASAGVSAAWVAWLLGCSPIVLAGMDCYTAAPGEKRETYFHSPRAVSTGLGQTLADHLHKWAKLFEIAPGARVSTLGGPTTARFATYPSVTTIPGPPDIEPKRVLAGGVLVEFLRDHDLRGISFKKGERFEVHREEARTMTIERIVRRATQERAA